MECRPANVTGRHPRSGEEGEQKTALGAELKTRQSARHHSWERIIRNCHYELKSGRHYKNVRIQGKKGRRPEGEEIGSNERSKEGGNWEAAVTDPGEIGRDQKENQRNAARWVRMMSEAGTGWLDISNFSSFVLSKRFYPT